MNLKLNDKRKKNRLGYEEKVKEQGMKQEGEIRRLKDTTRLEKEEREEQWNRKQKEHEAEVDQLKVRCHHHFEAGVELFCLK